MQHQFKQFCFWAACCLAGTCQAIGSRVNVDLVDRTTGEHLPVYAHKGQYWVAGIPGHRYAVAIRNRDGARALTVVSVDGVNVVTGETAAWSQSGYVLDGYQNTEITGWRKSRNDVATFVFTALPDSYAARTDRPANIGTIGVAVFNEYRPEPIVQMAPAAPMARGRLDAEKSAAPSANQEAMRSAAPLQKSEKLGTGHGEREHSAVSYTDFQRASSTPNEVIMIRYDSRANLVAMGVLPRRVRPPVQPDPFPGSSGFVPDPPAFR